jgi:D-alanine--D-alanine ligase
MLSALDYEKYEISKIGITKEGRWLFVSCPPKDILRDSWQKDARDVLVDFNNGGFLIEGFLYKPKKVIIAMHGEYGEDGRVQGLLDMLDIDYIGCDSFASSLSMDKHLTKLVAKSVGVPVARSFLVNNARQDSEILEKARWLGYPLFVKPCRAGSSVGVSRVKNEDELINAINYAHQYCNRVLIEEEIVGTETEVGVLVDVENVTLSEIGQLKHNGEFYTYYEKYEGGKTEYIIPAKITDKTKKELGECLKKLVFALDIRGYARFDFFVKHSGDIVFNEVNTLPGFTESSMLPMLFKHRGISKTQLLDRLILRNF